MQTLMTARLPIRSAPSARKNHVARPATGEGQLSGLSFAVKDVFDVAGSRTGFGHPAWLATHPPAEVTAGAVTRLLSAGADLRGRTLSDELCYSISGENFHYGMPINPAARERLPGGSSSGSAVAVAAGQVDFAIGTDCGGSVRVPAAYCGLFGMRPTHGRIALDGVSRFAPRFDTVGWFARDAVLLKRVGEALLGPSRPQGFDRVLLAVDAFEQCDPLVRPRAGPGNGTDRTFRPAAPERDRPRPLARRLPHRPGRGDLAVAGGLDQPCPPELWRRRRPAAGGGRADRPCRGGSGPPACRRHRRGTGRDHR
ncbi:amidase family protein [Ancylobacter dichloromethanicus]